LILLRPLFFFLQEPKHHSKIQKISQKKTKFRDRYDRSFRGGGGAGAPPYIYIK
jgi:hypothetical protein